MKFVFGAAQDRPECRRWFLQGSVRSMRLFAVVLIAAGLFGGAHAAEPGREFLPPEHWAYEALGRFEALGLCGLPSEKPYSRPQVIDMVRSIDEAIAAAGRALSTRDAFELERLHSEFSGIASRFDPGARYDPPVVALSDTSLRLEGDVDLALAPARQPFQDETDVFLKSRPGLKLHVGSRLTYEMRYDLTFGPERGDRARNEKPSRREKSFKGLTSLYERSYAVYQTRRITLVFGREYIDWGPSDWGNLLVSRTAGSLDQLQVRIRFRNVNLSAVHAPLSTAGSRRLAAHRLEVRLKRLLVGISESVIYSGRGFDPVYAFPIASYYANQFNERGDDNILWSVDLKCRLRNALVLYGSLLIDDFQFERDDGTPDKLGFDIGGTLALSRPVPLTLKVRYRYVDIYTYTHRDSANAHVAGFGLPGAGDPLLGGYPGPDTDSWRAEIRAFPRPDLPVTLGLSGLRRGEGNDFRAFNPGDDPNPSFPSGVVERTFGIDLALAWELRGGSAAGLFWQWLNVDNRDAVAGNDADDTSIALSVMWDF
ncbi:MAG: hypothetical protein HY770_03500 [Chitinivibrionia bacterium]|nr:hypothetical protein [Chitinivibrionia bacterium]